MGDFSRPRLVLTNNAILVTPVEVTYSESQCFTVDPNQSPRSNDPNVVIPPGNPFLIVSACRTPPAKPFTRAADLGVDPSAITLAWHQLFDRQCTIILQMRLSNNTVKDLTVDLSCAQHSSVALPSGQPNAAGAMV